MTLARPLDLSTVTAKQRVAFWAKVDRSGDGCWLWTASTNGKGYGSLAVGKLGATWLARASRIAWVLAHHDETLRPEDCVLHKCDTPLCVRASHLFLGSQSGNMRDMVNKGRHCCNLPSGTRHHSAKLSEDGVRAIRRSRDLQRTIAKRHGLSQATVSMIKRRLIWKDVK